ncbi:MAG: hypothetical protein QXY45_01775 [Candidatus Aenigmatarchaeota archaeon]
MRKLTIIFILLTIATSLSQETTTLITETPNMETTIFETTVTTTTITTTTSTTLSNQKLKMKTIALLGKGIAISQIDSSNFRAVKIGIARAIVANGAEEKNFNLGIIELDGTKYLLKNVLIKDGELAAEIYQLPKNTDNQKIGSIQLKSYLNQEMKMEIWAGTLNLSENFNLYIINVPRQFKNLEIKEKIKEYCSQNENEKCKYIEKKCLQNTEDESCKQIILDYCENNIDDSRCRSILNQNCSNNTDERCQRFMVKMTKRFCEERPNSTTCIKIRNTVRNFDKIYQEIETKNKMKETIKSKIDERRGK